MTKVIKFKDKETKEVVFPVTTLSAITDNSGISLNNGDFLITLLWKAVKGTVELSEDSTKYNYKLNGLSFGIEEAIKILLSHGLSMFNADAYVASESLSGLIITTIPYISSSIRFENTPAGDDLVATMWDGTYNPESDEVIRVKHCMNLEVLKLGIPSAKDSNNMGRVKYKEISNCPNLEKVDDIVIDSGSNEKRYSGNPKLKLLYIEKLSGNIDLSDSPNISAKSLYFVESNLGLILVSVKAPTITVCPTVFSKVGKLIVGESGEWLLLGNLINYKDSVSGNVIGPDTLGTIMPSI